MWEMDLRPNSSTSSRLRRDNCRWRLSSGIPSLVSSGPLYRVFTGATAQRGSPAREAARAYCGGYDHLERGRWNFAQSVLVDVDALDDVAVLGAVHDLVLRVLGLVQGQSQRFHRFHLLVVGETYAPKRVACIEHNTSEGARRRTKEGLAAARPGDAAAS